jgi:hypothetical protein
MKALHFGLLLGLLSLTGCTRPYANFAVETTPASQTMKQRTITTEIPADATALTQNTNRIVIEQLKVEGFKYVPGPADIVMSVKASRGGRTVGGHIGYTSVENEEADMVTIELNAREGGRVIWDGAIEGRGEYLSGQYAPGCIRTLLERYQMHESGEETCFRLDQMPKKS